MPRHVKWFLFCYFLLNKSTFFTSCIWVLPSVCCSPNLPWHYWYVIGQYSFYQYKNYTVPLVLNNSKLKICIVLWLGIQWLSGNKAHKIIYEYNSVIEHCSVQLSSEEAIDKMVKMMKTCWRLYFLSADSKVTKGCISRQSPTVLPALEPKGPADDTTKCSVQTVRGFRALRRQGRSCLHNVTGKSIMGELESGQGCRKTLCCYAEYGRRKGKCWQLGDLKKR